MIELFWRVLAWCLSREPVANWIIRRAMRTPYTQITSADGREVYMSRWWLFNPYPAESSGRLRRFSWCPISVRVHHINRPDQDRHLHDHPWNARTIILQGGYLERRQGGEYRVMSRGKTARLRFGEYHRIASLAPLGAMTLFVTGKYRGTWGFLVNGEKVPYKTYLAERAANGRTL